MWVVAYNHNMLAQMRAIFQVLFNSICGQEQMFST